MIPSIETKRFILREFTEKDAQDLFELDSNPEVHKFLGNHPATSMEEVIKDIHYVRRQYKSNGIGRWIVEDKQSGECVGWSGLKYETNGINNRPPYYDIGYRLKQQHWGKGIASETALASLEYGFEKMTLGKICAAAHVNNIASNTILKKIGLSYVESFYYETEKCHWYQVTKKDWEKLNNL